MYTRYRKRWTINECLQLQREYELLGWDIDKIAKKHQRSPNGIMNKLDREGFADYNQLYINYYGLNSYISTNNDEEEEEKVDMEANLEEQYDDKAFEEVDIKKHIMRLEKQVIALTEMFMKQNTNNKSMFSLFS